MTEIIYSKFSNERDRKFAVRTDILEESGRCFVKKSALYPEGKRHEMNMLRWYEVLSKMYEKAPFTCNLCEKGEEGVFFEYVNGMTLEEKLDELLAAGRVSEVQEHLIQYASIIQELHSQETFEMTEEFQKVFGDLCEGETAQSQERFWKEWKCAKITNIDFVCSNLILAEKPVAVDYEWTFDFPVPVLFVVYRIIWYYGKTHAHREVINTEAILEKFQITEREKLVFAKMEQHFQNYICGEHIPMRELYEVMTPGVSLFSEEKTEEEMLQIYFSDGQDFSEENSIKLPFLGQRIERKVAIPQNCTELRLDPGDFACAVRVEELSFEKEAVNLAECVIPEGAIYGNWVYIGKSDPYIYKIMVPEGARELKIALQVFPENEDVLKNTIAQLEQMKNSIVQLEQTKNQVQGFGNGGAALGRKLLHKAKELRKKK